MGASVRGEKLLIGKVLKALPKQPEYTKLSRLGTALKNTEISQCHCNSKVFN